MGIERRQQERIDTDLRVRYGQFTADREAIAVNVSMGGLFVKTNDIFPTGSELTLEIEFPERTVQLSGEVMWAIKVPEHQKEMLVCGMGVRFVQTEPGWPELFERWKQAATAGAGRYS